MLPLLTGRRRYAVLRPIIALAASLPLAAVGLVSAPAGAVVPTTTTVSASPTSSVQGDPVTLTATVSIQNVGGVLVTPSRQVDFTATAGGPTVQLGSAQLPSGCLLTVTSCSASLTTTALPVGNVTVTATYVGDSVASSSSGTTQVTVTQRPPSATPPDAPSLTATSMTGVVRLVWTAAGDGGSAITGYRLYRSTASSGPYARITGDLPTGHYDDTTGKVGTTYFYKATVVNGAGESAFSNIASGSPQALSGPDKYDVTQCSANQTCTGHELRATSPGSRTYLQTSTTKSTAQHTLTSAIGGPELQGCTTDYHGYSGSFNDTSTDAYKEARIELTGDDAVYMKDQSPYASGGRIGCLGLGTPWQTSPTTTAQWSPADGLYVGTPAYCSEMSIYKVGPDEWSQPCLEARVFYTSGTEIDWHFEMVFELPPGDGIISGTKCC